MHVRSRSQTQPDQKVVLGADQVPPPKPISIMTKALESSGTGVSTSTNNDDRAVALLSGYSQGAILLDLLGFDQNHVSGAIAGGLAELAASHMAAVVSRGRRIKHALEPDDVHGSNWTHEHPPLLCLPDGRFNWESVGPASVIEVLCASKIKVVSGDRARARDMDRDTGRVFTSDRAGSIATFCGISGGAPPLDLQAHEHG